MKTEVYFIPEEVKKMFSKKKEKELIYPCGT